MALIQKTKLTAFGYGLIWVLTWSFLTGCGSIIHGSKQQVSFDSTPQGATVKLANGTHFTTPQTVEMRRADEHTVTIEKAGYEPERITLNRDFNALATILGNILWLVPGVIVDVLVGGAWTLDPERVNVNLIAEKSVTSSSPGHNQSH